MAKTSGEGAVAPAPGRKPRVTYSKKLDAAICEALAEGWSMSAVCRLEKMPTLSAVNQWMKTREGFAERVRLAREAAGDRAADDVLAAARAVTSATASADRVRISALQWSAAKAAPHKYGARAEAAPAEPRAPVRLAIRVRQFERLVGPDGVAFLRELKVEGEK